MSTLYRLGFTGPRTGMTAAQMRGVYGHIANIQVTRDWDDILIEVHHGDCQGSDAEFHVIATVLGCRTVAHPPVNDSKRAWCKADEIRPPKDYLQRDWDIAFETARLLATPATLQRPPGPSGTWTTISYAEQLNRPVTLVLSDGQLSHRLIPGVPR